MSGRIVAIGGLPGSGKTSQVQPYLDQGYTRVNRDTTGGSLRSKGDPFWQEVYRLHAQGVRKFVMDNTWCMKEHRDLLIQVANELGLRVDLRMLDVDIPKAQLFTARREFQRHGRLLHKGEHKTIGDANTFPPGLHFSFQKHLDAAPPSLQDGFALVEWVPVPVVWGPDYVNRALILDLDGTVRATPDERVCPYPRTPAEVVILQGRSEILQQKQREGWLLLGATNQSGISRKPTDPKYVSEKMVQECIRATERGLGVTFDKVLYAPDRGGPPQTFWRKPCPGMGVAFIEEFKLAPGACTMVGDMTSDRTFARRCGFQFAWADEFFA